MSQVNESRYLPVPPGIAGERADAGIAKLLGLSRAAAADLLTKDCVHQNGKLIGKSDKLIVDAMLDIQIPAVRNRLEIHADHVEGFKSYIKTPTLWWSTNLQASQLTRRWAGMAQQCPERSWLWASKFQLQAQQSVKALCNVSMLAPAGLWFGQKRSGLFAPQTGIS